VKKVFLRSVAIAIILTGAIAFLVWYWTMKREVPLQARVIPSDAFAVLTLNLRELADDRAGDEHLFPEMTDESMLQKELAPFTRAVTANGSTGMEETSDVLLFTYHSGEAGFFGIAVQLEDSTEFGNLMRIHVKNEYNIIPWTNDGIPIMRFDTTAAVIGWTNDVALFLYPLGNHGIATVSTQCIKLLKQQKENSVLMNENFREMELNTFAMSLWVQTKPFKNFTGGGKLVDQLTNGIQYFNYMADFQDGEILIRSEWHLDDGVKKDQMKEFEFPCELSTMNSFIRTSFDPEIDSLYGDYEQQSGMRHLPLTEEQIGQIIPFLSGDCIFITHDTTTRAISTPLALNEDRDTTHVTNNGETYSFLVTHPDEVRALITSYMEHDSIPLTTRGWEYDYIYSSGWRMILDDHLLTVTNDDRVDGRPHAITGELAGYMAYFNLHKIFLEQDGSLAGWLMPKFDDAHKFLADNLVTCSNTLPVQFGNVRRSEIKITFRNEDVNGLVQAEELLRKIYFTE
jgi:hypothetical protein